VLPDMLRSAMLSVVQVSNLGEEGRGDCSAILLLLSMPTDCFYCQSRK